MTLSSSQIWEGVAGTAQLGMTIAVSIGVFVAWRQLSSPLADELAKRRAGLGEEIMIAANHCADVLDEVRTPGELPIDKPNPNRLDYVQARLSRLFAESEKFSVLRLLAIKQNALIGNNQVAEALAEFQELRFLTFRSLRAVKHYYQRDHMPLSKEQSDRGEAAVDDMYGAGDPTNEITMKLRSALGRLGSELQNTIRLGTSK